MSKLGKNEISLREFERLPETISPKTLIQCICGRTLSTRSQRCSCGSKWRKHKNFMSARTKYGTWQVPIKEVWP